MKKYTGLFLCAICALALLLTGCTPGIVFTSPSDEDFQEDFREAWDASMEELQGDLETDLEDFWDGFRRGEFRRDRGNSEKDHYWKIQDLSDPEGAIIEVGTVTDEEPVKALDDLLSDDGTSQHLTEDPGDPAYSYVYCQQETLKTGQKEEDREYEELVRFTISGEQDVVTLRILEELPSLPGVDLGDVLTFSYTVPAETAEALRNPAQFVGEP